MTTIKCLPDEIIAIILKYNCISIEDVVSFTSTCKRFHRTLLDRKFWERKFYQRYFFVYKLCNINFKTQKTDKRSFESLSLFDDPFLDKKV